MQNIKRKSSSGQSEKAFLKKVLVDLANTGDDGIAHFRNKWGRLYSNRKLYNDQNLLKRRDELRLLWKDRIWQELGRLSINLDSPTGTPFKWEDGTEFPRVSKYAGSVHDDWIDHLAEAPQQFQVSLEEFICEHWLHLEKGRGWVVRWRSDQKGIMPKRSNLPAVLIYGCLEHADRLFICRNPECPAPYFIAKRLDQKYCSNICAGPAKKAAKLKWWHTNLGKKSKAKKSKGKKSIARKRK